jgi:hypothetical protein
MLNFKAILLSGFGLAMGLSAITGEAAGKRIPASSRQDFASAYDLTGIKGPDPLPEWHPPQNKDLSQPNIPSGVSFPTWRTVYQSTPPGDPGCLSVAGASYKWPLFRSVFNPQIFVQDVILWNNVSPDPVFAQIYTGRVRISYTTQATIARNYDLAYVQVACRTSPDGTTYGSCNAQAQNGPNLLRNNQVTNNQIFTTYTTSFSPPSNPFYLDMGLAWGSTVASLVGSAQGCFNNLVVEAEFEEYHFVQQFYPNP